MRNLRYPSRRTFIPSRSVRLTDRTYDLDWKSIPAVLSVSDVRWEREYGESCRMRLSLEKAGYLVDPSGQESEK